MTKENIKRVMGQAKFHTNIVLRGLARTIWGALIAGLIGIAVYGFTAIGKESGYAAVGDFVTSCATLVVALVNVYQMGRKKKVKK